MKNREYEERMERTVRAHWFPNHIAKRTGMTSNPDVPQTLLGVLDWRKPDTGIFAVRYIIDRNTLHVTGDIGCAVFRWSDQITWEFLSQCSLDYFTEKCEASEHGRPFMQWNDDVALTEIEAIAKDLIEQGHDNVLDGIDYQDEDECRSWLQRNWSTHELEAETMAGIMNAGRVISPRCIGMWVGLKMAKEQLQK